jgi:hypothetical protein
MGLHDAILIRFCCPVDKLCITAAREQGRGLRSAPRLVSDLVGIHGRLGVISASFPTRQQVDGCEHNDGDDDG